MDGFNKVRRGIAGLKDEKEDLKNNYKFLTRELDTIVKANSRAIKEFAGKSESLATSMAAMQERLGRTDDSIESTSVSLSSTISAIQKRLDTQKKTLENIGNGLQKAMDNADSAARGISDSRKYEKDVSKSIQHISTSVGGLDEKLGSFEKSVSETMSSIDNKFTAGITLVSRSSEEQSSVIKDHDSAIQRLTLSLQALRKDLEKENERVLRVKEIASKSATRLELLGTLQAKMKHIEDVKTGLVKGVETIKSMKNEMAVLEQKTKDLGSKLTDADKFLESRLLEKTKMLDSHMAEKTDSMEYQMEERLKLLESNIVKRNNEVISKINLDMAGLGKDVTGMNKMISSVKTDHAATKKRLAEIESLRQRISDVEKLGKTLSENVAEIKKLHKHIEALGKDMDSNKIRMEDVNAAIDSKVDYNISAVKKDAAFNSAALKRVDEGLNRFSLDLNSLKKDMGSNTRGLSGVKASLEGLQEKAGDLEKLQIKLGDIGDTKAALTDAMEAKLEERIKFLEMTLRQKADNIAASLSEKSSAAETRLNKDITAIKKELIGKSRSIDAVKARLEKIGRLEERLKTVDQEKDIITRNVSSLQNTRADISKMDERSRSHDKDLRALKAQVESGLIEIRGKLDTRNTEDGNKFSTAVKAFLNARADLNKKLSLLDLKVSESNRRIGDFTKLVTRIDLLEKKMDRMTERSSEIRRDMDSMERKGESDEKVMVVDLGNERALTDEF